MRAACFVGTVVVLASLLGCGSSPDEKEKEGQDWRPRTRDELKEAVMGKSKEEVRKLLGVPASTSETGERSRWRYDRISYDPVTDKIDARTVLFFSKEGKVRSVGF